MFSSQFDAVKFRSIVFCFSKSQTHVVLPIWTNVCVANSNVSFHCYSALNPLLNLENI
jgi:hypothetical protein